jgi:biopolymer transport protein ExbD
VDSGFSAASMTDMVFLLLMFVLMALTLVNPNALRLVLPKSSNQITEKPYTTVSITPAGDVFVDGNIPVTMDRLESVLQEKLAGKEKPLISLHADEKADWGRVAGVMEIARRNNYSVIAAMRNQ